MKSLRIILIVSAVVLSLLLLLVVFLPGILSMDPARRWVLSRFGKRSGAELNVEQWSLSWRSGIELKGLAYRDKGGEVALKAAEITTGSGILDLLSKRRNLGNLEIVEPELRLSPAVRLRAAAPVGKAPPETAPAAPPREPSRRAAPGEPARLPDICGTAVVRDGRLIFAPPQVDPTLVLEHVTVRMEISSRGAPLAFSIEARQPEAAPEAASGSGRLSLSGSLMPSGDRARGLAGPSVSAGLKLDAVDLAPFGAVAGAYAGLPRIKGTVTAEASVEIDGPDFKAILRVDGLAAADEGNASEPGGPLTALLQGKYGGAEVVTVDKLWIDADFGRIDGSITRAATDLRVDLNVSRAVAELAKFVELGNTSLGGELTGSIKTKAHGDHERKTVVADAVWNDFLISGDSIEIREPVVKMDFESDIAGGNAVLRSFSLSSRPISISATGSVSGASQDRVLELDGTLTPDFELLGKMFLPRDGASLALEGKSPGPCGIRVALDRPEGVALADVIEAEARLRLSRLTFMGVDARDVDADLKMSAGRVHAALTAKVNEGELSVTPVFELGNGETAVVLEEQTQVLKGVKLTREMMSELLAAASPLLRTSGILGGTVDLAMEPFRLPLGKTFKQEAAFRGEIGFSDVVLEPAGPLLEILQLARLDADELVVSNGAVTVTCNEGWITATPLTLVSGQYHLRLSGSFSLDGPLKYTAELPITRNMVGADAYEQLQGIYLKLPIGGTVARPKIGADSFAAMVRSAVKDAGAKVIVEQGAQLLNRFLKKMEAKQSEQREPSGEQGGDMSK